MTAKITMPAPSTMHFYRCTDFADPAVYADAEAFFADLAKIYRAGDRGSRAEPAAATCSSTRWPSPCCAIPPSAPRSRRRAKTPTRWSISTSQAINDCVAERARRHGIGIHMCRGNFRGRYLSEGGYESVAERFFKDCKVTPLPARVRHGARRRFQAAALRAARTRAWCSGLVSTKTPECWRRSTICSAAPMRPRKFIDLDRLGIGPQCGFASTAAGNPLTEADERAKLRLVVAAARAIWG